MIGKFLEGAAHGLRYRYDLLKITREAHRTPVRALFLSDGASPQNEAQFDPFFAFRHELRNRLGLVFTHETIDAARPPSASILVPFDVIGLKFHYKARKQDVLRCAEAIAKGKRAGAKLVYFDGNDEANIQWPELLGICDLYWKKHALRNRTNAVRIYEGSTNLTHHVYGRRLEDAPLTAMAPDLLDRIVCGVSIGLDGKILALDNFLHSEEPSPAHSERPHDIVLRADVPDNWMGQLREPAVRMLESMAPELDVLLPRARVSAAQYAKEMQSSKMCVSPFGYGEICWRDFEAVAYGCLLFKPDMSHMESHPDIFHPHETYVPVRWDFADLPDKVQYYLENETERLRIVRNARNVLRRSHQPEWFTDKVNQLLGERPTREKS